jgi:hypothetical protein
VEAKARREAQEEKTVQRRRAQEDETVQRRRAQEEETVQRRRAQEEETAIEAAERKRKGGEGEGGGEER